MHRGTRTRLTGRALAALLIVLLALGGLTRLLFAAAQPPAAGFIYWTDEVDSRPHLGSIWRANLDGSGPARLVSGQQDSFGLALDVSGGKMYWSDEDDGTIRSANLDGTGQKLLSSSDDNPVGIALDVAAGKIYWTEKTAIVSANLDGSGDEGNLIPNVARPLGIALDLPGGKMYWCDYTSNIIERANLEGSSRQQVVNGTGEGSPEDVALDLAHGKLYWTITGDFDSNNGSIGRANLDGSDPEILLGGLGVPVGIALDVAGGKMYWADSHYGHQGQGDISVANLDGTGRQTILKGLNVPGRIALQLPSVP